MERVSRTIRWQAHRASSAVPGQRASREDRLDVLTAREREVAALIAAGRSNRGIAQRLVVTEVAVEKHVSSILAKFDIRPGEGTHRRVLAVITYLRCSDGDGALSNAPDTERRVASR